MKSINLNEANTLFKIKINGIKNPNKNGIKQLDIAKNSFLPFKEDNV